MNANNHRIADQNLRKKLSEKGFTQEQFDWLFSFEYCDLRELLFIQNSIIGRIESLTVDNVK